MRFRNRLGCRFGQPHDLKIINETPHAKHEVCLICNKKFRFNKGYKGRVANNEYLKAHVRNYAQKSGATKRIYNQIYNPHKTIIHI